MLYYVKAFVYNNFILSEHFILLLRIFAIFCVYSKRSVFEVPRNTYLKKAYSGLRIKRL